MGHSIARREEPHFAVHYDRMAFLLRERAQRRYSSKQSTRLAISVSFIANGQSNSESRLGSRKTTSLAIGSILARLIICTARSDDMLAVNFEDALVTFRDRKAMYLPLLCPRRPHVVAAGEYCAHGAIKP